jgi:GTP pyrophosphokinase
VSQNPCYSPKLDEALALVTDAFRNKIRKGSGIPYLTHLLQVMVLVAEHGGDEEQMMAALLHDYLEDIEGAQASLLHERFGPRVAGLVEGLSDSVTLPKPPWKERKETYIAHLRIAPAELKLVSSADKLHNARSIHRDFRMVGEPIWDRFTATREQTLWYYRAIVDALANDWEHAILAELRDEVHALHRSTGAESLLDSPARSR